MITELPETIKNVEGVIYYLDQKKNLIHGKLVKPLDRKRDKLVMEIAAQILKEHLRLRKLKKKIFQKVLEYDRYSRTKNKAAIKPSGRGTFNNFSQTVRVKLDVHDYMTYNEIFEQAKEIIFDLIKEWSEPGKKIPGYQNIIQFATAAFDQKDGKISQNKVSKIKKFNIKDKRWKHAIALINEAEEVAYTGKYINLHIRDENGKFQRVSLAFSEV